MGNRQPKPIPPKELENALVMTNFNKNEIESLWERFQKLDRLQDGELQKRDFMQVPEMAINPLADRIIALFMSQPRNPSQHLKKGLDEKINNCTVNFYQFVTCLDGFQKNSKIEHFNYYYGGNVIPPCCEESLGQKITKSLHGLKHIVSHSNLQPLNRRHSEQLSDSGSEACHKEYDGRDKKGESSGKAKNKQNRSNSLQAFTPVSRPNSSKSQFLETCFEKDEPESCSTSKFQVSSVNLKSETPPKISGSNPAYETHLDHDSTATNSQNQEINYTNSSIPIFNLIDHSQVNSMINSTNSEKVFCNEITEEEMEIIVPAEKNNGQAISAPKSKCHTPDLLSSHVSNLSVPPPVDHHLSDVAFSKQDLRLRQRQKLELLFRIYDTDGNNFIGKEELFNHA